MATVSARSPGGAGPGATSRQARTSAPGVGVSGGGMVPLLSAVGPQRRRTVGRLVVPDRLAAAVDLQDLFGGQLAHERVAVGQPLGRGRLARRPLPARLAVRV